MQHIKYNSLAGLISTFLQLAANSAFQSNFFMCCRKMMYLVLLLTSLLTSPQMELVKTDTPLIVVTMYERDFSRLLT